MSGGSYDYAYTRVDDMAGSLRDVATDPLRRAFKAHLLKVAKAMRDVEWEDSCDGADWQTSVRAVLTRTDEIEAATAILCDAIDQANSTLERLETPR